MSEENRCPQCGVVLSAQSPQGLCPGCLLKRGLETFTYTDGKQNNQPGEAAEVAPPAPEELAGLFPDLEILELIGRGGMGVVYKARQKQLDRLVALKILSPRLSQDPAFAERFAREARAMAKLSHPHVVAIHDFGEVDGLYYFLMEFVDGVNLRRLLDAGKLQPEEALAVVPQICDALQYAHDHGVVHRDIKPENVLLDQEGRVKIADFGIAKLVGVEDPNRHASPNATPDASPDDLTAAGQVLGTPQYMAPEQVERPLEVDHRVDIYALGVVFYQMLTGELPKDRFVPPSQKVQIDVRLDEVVLRAMEKEPELRYQQASEVKTRVEDIVSNTYGSEESVGSPSRSSKSLAIVPWTWGVVPWQIWIVGAFLILEGIGNLFAIPTNPMAIKWLLAKCLFLIGLFRGWKWVFVLVLIVSSIHVAYFLTFNPRGAIMNLVLMGLIGSAYRFYFSKPVSRGGWPAWKLKIGELALLISAFLVLEFAGPMLIGSSTQAPAAVAETLEEYRQTLVAYDLGFGAVFPRQGWKHYDAERLEMYPGKDDWPKVLGHVDTDPNAFKIIHSDSLLNPVIIEPNAFMIPLKKSLVVEGNATLLFLKGIRNDGTVIAKGYVSLVCLGEMSGRMNFDTYATALIKGEMSGRITSGGYLNLVVTGKFTGRMLTDSYAMIYLLGEFEGDLELNASKVYIAGRTNEVDLSRITGRGEVYLEASDLPAGEHKIRDLKVTVGKTVQKVLTEELHKEKTTSTASAKGMTSLSEAVRVFNARAKNNPVGKSQPPLTKDEIIAAIRWALVDPDELPVSDKTLQVLREITKSHQLPSGFELEVLTGFIPNNQLEVTKWSVRLRIPAEPQGTTCISIREKPIRSRLLGETEKKNLEKWQKKWASEGIVSREVREYKKELAKADEIDREKKKNEKPSSEDQASPSSDDDQKEPDK